MLKEIIENKLQQLNKFFKQTGDNFLLTTCLNPNHNDKKPSFSINTETGHSFCFTCGYKVDKEYWLNGVVEDEEEIERQIKLNQLKSKIKKEEKTKHKIILPPKNDVITNNFRGVSNELWNKLDCYICKVGKYSNRIVMPIKYLAEVKAFETRAIDPNTQPKYLHSKGLDVKSLVYPYNLLYNSSYNYIVIVEGILDAISGWELGLPCIPNFGVAVNVNMEKINTLISLGIETIYIALDKDEAGKRATDNLLNSLYKDYFDVKKGESLDALKLFYNSPVKDLNDYLVLQKLSNSNKGSLN